YGDGVAGRIREVTDDHVDALIDTFGGGYVALAVEELGVAPERVDTIIDWAAAEQYGVKTEGTAAAASSRSRSRACSRSIRCAKPIASSSAGTPAGRSCSSPRPPARTGSGRGC